MRQFNDADKYKIIFERDNGRTLCCSGEVLSQIPFFTRMVNFGSDGSREILEKREIVIDADSRVKCNALAVLIDYLTFDENPEDINVPILRGLRFALPFLELEQFSGRIVQDHKYLGLSSFLDAKWPLQDLYINFDFKNITIQILHSYDYTDENILTSGFPASVLKRFGYTASQLKKASYPTNEIIDAGYSLEQIREAGIKIAELKGTYFGGIHYFGVNEVFVLRNANYTLHELKEANIPLDILIRHFPPKELRGADYSSDEVLSAVKEVNSHGSIWYTSANMKKANYTLKDIKDSQLYSVSDMRLMKYTVTEMSKYYTIDQMRQGGYTVKQMKEGGYTAKQMRDGGYTAKEMRDGGYTAKAMRNVGYTAKEMRDGGYTAKAMRDGGYTAEEMHKGGFTIQELRQGGFTLVEFIKTNHFTFDQLVSVFTKDHIYRTVKFELKHNHHPPNPNPNLNFFSNDRATSLSDDRKAYLKDLLADSAASCCLVM